MAAAWERRALPVVRLEPSEVKLRRSRGYQWARWLSLASGMLLPLWLAWHHRTHNGVESGGLPDAMGWGPSTWTALGGRWDWVGAPWTIRVLGIEFMDPLAAAGLALTGAPVVPLLWALPATVLLVVLLGRFFCGWLCPYVLVLNVSNAVRGILYRLGVNPPDVALPARLPFVVLVGVLVLTAATGMQLVPLVYPPSIIHREILRSVFHGTLGAGALFILGTFLFDTLVARAGFCRYLCPGGAMFRLLGYRSPLRVVRTPQDCTDCTACDVVCNYLQSPMTDRHDAGCERCGRCISACPTGALRLVVLNNLPGPHHGV